ncbi:MAG TPA: heavy metal-binding domain-containing protein [Synergistaceae bacterium]|nr:heavy metal-binding domain-containing protein [Synergistaceae bacterium]HPQ37932.1 heavy metal-binding domain-containing protein [Synergistaceae bacterium]
MKQRETREEKLLLTTGPEGCPENARILGPVWGACVLSRSVVKDFSSALRNMAGGELGAYTSLLDDALGRAMDRLENRAAAMGAQGVSSIRIATPEVSGGAAEVVVMGTAWSRTEGR